MGRRNEFIIRDIAMGMVLLVAFAGTARAAGFAEPNVEYSADQHMSAEGKVIKSKVYHAKSKERMDFDLGDTKQYVITRLDKKVSWMVMPEKKMYIETSLEEGKKGPGGQTREIRECSVTRSASGKETVNGVSTTRSDVDMSCPDGTRFSGSIWESKEGILVKMDAVAKEGSGSKGRITVELKNLKIGKLGPKIFEVPDGYQQMKMPGGMMPGMGGTDMKDMMSGPSQRAKPRAAEPGDRGGPGIAEKGEAGRNETGPPPDTGRSEPGQQEEKGAVDKALEPVKKLKGLFGF